MPYLQVPVLLGGLAFALYTLWRILGERTRNRLTVSALPPAIFLTLATFGFLWLYLG